MNKTFNIQNMETYFHNFVPCTQHRKEPITNFCTQRSCLKFMCPECVENHSREHTSHPIESIKTCIRKTSDRIQSSILDLEREAAKINLANPQSIQKRQSDMIQQIHRLREQIIDDINQYFISKQTQIKRSFTDTRQTKNKVQELQKQLNKAIEELRQLGKNVFVNQQCVNSVKKANKIDYQGLILHFQCKNTQIHKGLNLDLIIDMKQANRDDLKKRLGSLVDIRVNQQQLMPNDLQFGHTRISPDLNSSPFLAKYQANPPPPQLSADHILNQKAIKISSQNYFQSHPFLHFFEVSKPNLHILKINDLKQNQKPKWIIQNLDIQFQIPSFSRSIATEDGNIYLIGGTIEKTLQKSKLVYQYDPEKHSLRKVSELIIGRSSQSMVCVKNNIYIVGGMDDTDFIPKDCQIFNPKTNQCKTIAPCKYQTINSTLCTIGTNNLLKLGGVDGEGRNSDFIQIFNIYSNMWSEVDPTIQDLKSQFSLLSCCGWAAINQQQIFIFGGYNEECNNESSKMGYIFEINKDTQQCAIKYVNMKNLPHAQGFWNPQSIVQNGFVYALQNIDGEDGFDCVEGKRNLLVFNGKVWLTHSDQ